MSLENNNNNGNENKKNKKNNNKKRSFYQIMDKQGFYIILILCVGIVGATSFWVSNQESQDHISEGPNNPFGEEVEPEVQLVEDDVTAEDNDAEPTGRIGEGKPEEANKPLAVENEKSNVSKETSDNAKEVQEIVEKPKETIKNPDEESESTEEDIKDDKKSEAASTSEIGEEYSTNISMSVPVMGKMSLPFADDRLVYHKTLDQWSTHKGIDIKASEGTPVKAALDGEVVEVINDSIIGITITLKHDNDLITRYSNLSTDAMVNVGDKVTEGQIISGVGKTASNKTLEGPLLHFQVLKDDKLVNPENYIGKLEM